MPVELWGWGRDADVGTGITLPRERIRGFAIRRNERYSWVWGVGGVKNDAWFAVGQLALLELNRRTSGIAGRIHAGFGDAAEEAFGTRSDFASVELRGV